MPPEDAWSFVSWVACVLVFCAISFTCQEFVVGVLQNWAEPAVLTQDMRKVTGWAVGLAVGAVAGKLVGDLV